MIIIPPYKNNDELWAYLGTLGYVGTIDDRLFGYLRAEGYTGGLSDMIQEFTATGGFDTVTSLSLLGYVAATPSSTQALAANVDELMQWDTVIADTVGTFATPFETITAPTGSKYAKVFAFRDCFSDNGFARWDLEVNGSSVAQLNMHVLEFGVYYIAQTVLVDAGDTVGISLVQDGNATMEAGGYFGVEFYG